MDSTKALTFRQVTYHYCNTYDDFLQILEQQQIDLMIIAVDGADGMEGVIAARKFQPETKLIWFSNDKAFGSQSYRLNCTYFAVKPITEELLETAVSRCLAENHRRQKEEH